MSFVFLPKSQQADGQFNQGAILEKRPVVHSGEGSSFKPYSNLFYWAHAWSDVGSTIGEHPHQGFEILSFVMEGSIEHYDSGTKKWIPLKKGDVQIIRSGNGISHSEKLLPDSEIFQIWFDPDLQKAIQKNATYNDYFSTTFPVLTNKGFTEKILKGEGSPLEMDTPGVGIKQLHIYNGSFSMPLNPEKVYSVFVVQGSLKTNENELSKGDFIRIENERFFNASIFDETDLFIIESPVQPGYPTYAAMYLH